MKTYTMLKRIPHKEFEVIRGESKTRDYLNMQKKMCRFYLKNFIRKFEKINFPDRFLEIGPGPGYQTVLIAQKYNPFEIVGFEYSGDMINVARDYINEHGLSSKIT